jgi:hypothetical protein
MEFLRLISIVCLSSKPVIGGYGAFELLQSLHTERRGLSLLMHCRIIACFELKVLLSFIVKSRLKAF